jgi:hypothetical protein
VFLDRAYVLLDRDGRRFLIHLRGKQALDEGTLRAMAGEFANELLAQALRLRVVRQNQKLIEDIASLAISGAAGGAVHGDEAALIDLQDPGDDGFLDDPARHRRAWKRRRGRRAMSAAQATVRLHRALYAEDAIRRAAETFTDFAAFAVARRRDHYVVDVTEIDPGGRRRRRRRVLQLRPRQHRHPQEDSHA